MEIIGRNYGVQLEDISGIKAGAFRSKINEHGTDIIIILKRYIGAQMKTTWVSSLEVFWYKLRNVKYLQFHIVYLYRWKNHFCQLLNVLGANDVTQNAARAFEPVILQPSAFEFEVAIEMLTNYHLIDQKSDRCDPRRTWNSTLWDSYIIEVNVERGKNIQHRKVSVILDIYKKGEKIHYINYRHRSLSRSSSRNTWRIYKTLFLQVELPADEISKGNFLAHTLINKLLIYIPHSSNTLGWNENRYGCYLDVKTSYVLC